MKKENLNSIMTPFIEKELARSILKKKRSDLSSERRKKARADLNFNLLPLLKTYKAVLSFHSVAEEIDTTWLNQILAEEGKLYLPKVQPGALLQIHLIKNPSSDLIRSPWGLFEPDLSRCALTDIQIIDCILVPGLGFDKDHHRIGYGKGHYDQLLAHFKKHSLFPKTIGIGFKEQFCRSGLPLGPHDIPLDDLKLF